MDEGKSGHCLWPGKRCLGRICGKAIYTVDSEAWEELKRGCGTSSSSPWPDVVESCRMKTALGLGLVKGSANQPLSQTTGLLWHRAWWDRAVRDIPFLALQHLVVL